MDKKKNILITGGVGFIGSNLAQKLSAEGHNVISIDDYSFGKKENEIQNVRYINDDITNIALLTDSIDICYHLAAKARVQPSFEDPVDYFRVNVTGTMKVMEWAKENKVKVVYAGSSSKHFSPEDSPYAMYKFLGEQICKLYRKSYGIKAEIARFYNVYGPRENRDEKYGNVIGIWTTKEWNDPSDCWDGMQRRDFTHVNDIVDGLIKIGFSDISQEDGWELGTGNNYSVWVIQYVQIKIWLWVCIYSRSNEYKKTLEKWWFVRILIGAEGSTS